MATPKTPAKTAAKTPAKKASAPAKAAKPASPAKTKAPAAKPATAKPAAAKPAATKTNPSKQPRAIPHDQRRSYIEVAAYFIAERHGFTPGRELADWAAAEAEIDRLLAEGLITAP